VISTMMLRSMKQAKYSAESTGHFGLAAEYYSHFTSPIRRYPDLVIHRVIREVIENGGSGLTPERQAYLESRMADIAQQSSERERVAVDAERDTDQLKKAEYMLDKVGQEFEGIISSVTGFGMFIELENTVEGLIRLGMLTDDYYHFDDQHMILLGERTSRIFRIGDSITIRVANVNMDDHTIDFELPDMPKSNRRSGGDRGARGDNRGGRGAQGAQNGEKRGGGRGKNKNAKKAERFGKAAKAAKTDMPAKAAPAAASTPATPATGEAAAAGKRKRKKEKGIGFSSSSSSSAPSRSFGFGSGKGGYDSPVTSSKKGQGRKRPAADAGPGSAVSPAAPKGEAGSGAGRPRRRKKKNKPQSPE